MNNIFEASNKEKSKIDKVFGRVVFPGELKVRKKMIKDKLEPMIPVIERKLSELKEKCIYGDRESSKLIYEDTVRRIIFSLSRREINMDRFKRLKIVSELVLRSFFAILPTEVDDKYDDDQLSFFSKKGNLRAIKPDLSIKNILDDPF